MTIQLFCNSDIFLQTMWYLSPRDLCHAGGVCRSWQAGLNQASLKWHKEHHLPEVEGECSIRNFAVLATNGLNEKQIRALYSKYIGEPIGPTPFVTKAQIEELCKPDPDQPGKRKLETHRGVILFPAVKRSFGKGEAAMLDEQNRLTINEDGLDSEEKELTIPLSIYNAIELFNHPKAGKENGPVCDHIINKNDQYTAYKKNPSIVFVRCEVPEDSRDKSWENQQTRLPGTPIAGFLPLMIPCGFDILGTGTCFYVPTGIHKITYARTSDTVVQNETSCQISFQLSLGGFVPNGGVYVSPDDDYAHDHTGAVPMIPAEVQPVDLGSLDSGNGH